MHSPYILIALVVVYIIISLFLRSLRGLHPIVRIAIRVIIALAFYGLARALDLVK